MLGGAYTFLRIWGIPIRLHLSCIVLVPVFVGIFGFGVDAFIMLLGLFTSIALHELGHCWIAMRRGCHIQQILLTPVGGAAQMVAIPRRPLDELLMAIAGPFVSLVLALLFLLVGYSLPPNSRVTVIPIPVNAFAALGYLNVWLVMFNAVPAFPMDGGRVLRALLALRLSRLRATLIAARLGQTIAALFVILGGMMLAAGVRAMSCFVLMIIGILVFRAAASELKIVRIQEGYGMRPRPSAAPGNVRPVKDISVSPSPYQRPDDRAQP